MTDSALVINEYRFPIGWKQVFAEAVVTLGSDWFGAPVGGTCSWHYVLDPKRWYFGFSSECSPPLYDRAFNKGDFIEGLWMLDVAEVFIMKPDTGNYTEWNVGPQGAWWRSSFQAYRQRNSTAEVTPSIETYSSISHDRWTVGLACDRIVEEGLTESDLVHFSAIIKSPSQQFMSSGLASRGEPDFHNAAMFRKVDVKIGT